MPFILTVRTSEQQKYTHKKKYYEQTEKKTQQVEATNKMGMIHV